MGPLIWLSVIIVVPIVLVVAYLAWTKQVDLNTIGSIVSGATSRLFPRDLEWVLDRVTNEALKAMNSALRRGVDPGALVIRLGPGLMATVERPSHSDATGLVVASVRAALRRIDAQLPDVEQFPITVLRSDTGRPDELSVTVRPAHRDVRITPQPMAVPESQPADSTGGSQQGVPPVRAHLMAITPDMPDFTIDAGREYTVGRFSCDLALPEASCDSLKTSRSHASVRLTADGFLSVRDQSSTHGVFVNGERVPQADLHHGDELRLGLARWRVAIENPPA